MTTQYNPNLYTIFLIYKNDYLVHIAISNINHKLSDSTKLAIILNSPTIPSTLYLDYSYDAKTKQNSYTIKTHLTDIKDYQSAIQAKQAQLKNIGKKPRKPKAKPTKKSVAAQKKPKPSKAK